MKITVDVGIVIWTEPLKNYVYDLILILLIVLILFSSSITSDNILALEEGPNWVFQVKTQL